MDIRSILVSVGLGTHSAAVTYAANLAEAVGAEVVGLAAAEPTLAYAGIDNAQLATDYYAAERLNIENMIARAEDRFRAAIPASIPVKWRSFLANPTEMLIEQARRSDIVVAAAGDATGSGDAVDAGHLILACGRPVIMVREPVAAFKLDRISIAWKDTREARRAVADALPLLRRAKQVKVIGRSEGDMAAEAAGLNDIVEWLGHHEVQAESQLVEQGVDFLDAVGLLTLSDAPDLIVAGGYGHSRFREWLLGGVTRDLLGTRGVNRLLSN